MDLAKRKTLIEALATQSEPQVVEINRFFDGNDDEGSIGCNLSEHPGIDAFRTTFERIAQRGDVQAIYARITELDPGEDSWPFVDTVFVVGTISSDELAAELAELEPDEVGDGDDFGVPAGVESSPKAPVLAAWWD